MHKKERQGRATISCVPFKHPIHSPLSKTNSRLILVNGAHGFDNPHGFHGFPHVVHTEYMGAF